MALTASPWKFADRCGSISFLALLLGIGIAWYLTALPQNPVGVDEATYLNEALRLLRGEVIYRDIFDPTTPGWMYFMAALFRVFGATFGTARIAAAAIQAATAVTVYATCRLVDVRREIALATAVLCVLSAQLNYPLASQHWLATLLSALTLLAYLRRGRTTGGVFLVGILIGLLVAVHQQRGLSLGVGVGAFLMCDVLMMRPDRGVDGWTLARRALAFASAVATVVVPMLALLVWQAGFAPVWRALVTFPLVEYRQSAHCSWGFERDATYLPARILKFLPVALVLSVARAAGRGRGHDAERRRTAIIIGLHCAASIFSIWYYPDRIHIAFIVPSFAVLIAEHVEWMLPRLPHPLQLAGSATLAIALLTLSTLWLHGELNDRWQRHRHPYHGPFGRVDLPSTEAVDFYTQLETLVRDVPGRVLYCYQVAAYACLFVDGRNPTRFELLVDHYNSKAQIAEVTHMLTVKQVPYIVAFPATIEVDEPIAAFIRRNYEPLEDGSAGARYIWRRKSVPGQSID